MPVQMKLSRIIISDIRADQAIYLKELEGDRQFSIVIGICEASSIDRRVKGNYHPPRPQTYDLLVNIVDQLGAEPHSVLISELRNGTYYAQLRLMHEGELIPIDARPSDAIAVAVTCNPNLPIYVAEEVLDEVVNS